MALIRFSDRSLPATPWSEFDKMRRRMERWVDLLSGEKPGLASSAVFPALNVSEDPAEIIVNAEIPGVDPAGLDIAVEGDTLTIRGERKPAAGGEGISFHRRELQYGTFNRALTLPTKINAEKVSAKAKNGVLTIILPKAEEVKARQVSVNVD